jgi:hypothetical protein
VCTIEISKKQQKTKREEERKNLIEEARESNGVELHHKLFKRTQSGVPILHILVIKLRQVLFHGVTRVAHHDPPGCYFLLSHFPSSLARSIVLPSSFLLFPNFAPCLWFKQNKFRRSQHNPIRHDLKPPKNKKKPMFKTKFLILSASQPASRRLEEEQWRE